MSATPTRDGATRHGRRAGRRPVTSRSEIEHIALDLFTRQGFETTTVDEIASAAGIGRRTVFRYYASKNDIPWGAFDDQLDRMRATFAGLPADLPVMTGVRIAVLDFNDVAPDEQPWHRSRLRLILDTLKDACLVPGQAVQISQGGPFVFVVKSDNTLEQRPVKPGQRQGDLVVISEGLKPGETVVTSGQLALAPGMSVNAQPDPADGKPGHDAAR